MEHRTDSQAYPVGHHAERRIGRRVLVIAPAWVGDMVMAQTLFILLKQQGVEHLAILAPKWTLAVSERMPEVDERILGDFAHGQLAFGERKRLGQSLKGRFDAAIVLPKSLKSALVTFFARIPTRTGYVGECRYGLLNDARRLDKQRLPKTIQRFAYLGFSRHAEPADLSILRSLSALPCPKLQTDTDNQKRLTTEFALRSPVLALCPGAEYGPSKQWDLSRVAEVANRAHANGYQVIALGSPKDSAFIETIQQHAPQVQNLAGQTTIIDAIDLLAMADAVLTNDSGLMHIAAAVETNVFAVYGSTTPAMTPPLSDKAVIFADDSLSCRPCFKRQCPKSGSDFMACMQSTTAETVWQAILQTASSQTVSKRVPQRSES